LQEIAQVRRGYEVALTLVRPSDGVLIYRRCCPDAWGKLKAKGLPGQDLLVKAIACILRKPA
jgi:hypothetical protein